MVSADIAVVAAIMEDCCRSQSRCDGQSKHVAAGKVGALCVSILTPYRQVGHRNLFLFLAEGTKIFLSSKSCGRSVGPSQLPDYWINGEPFFGG